MHTRRRRETDVTGVVITVSAANEEKYPALATRLTRLDFL